MIKELLTEKLRPRKFEHLILSERVAKQLNGGVITQNMLFYGSPGTGKTSAAKVMAAGHPTKYINISDESSVEVIRTTITDFCSSMSALDDYDEGKPRYKVIILDEVDGASNQFFQALRGTIEKFAHNTRFIATCNFENKIPDAIMSRFEKVNFEFANEEERNDVQAKWSARVKEVISRLGMNITDVGLKEFVDRNFPDMRAALNKIQSFHTQGIKEITAEKVRELNWNFEDVYRLLLSPPDARKNYEFIVSEYGTKVEDLMTALGSEFVNYLFDKYPEKASVVPQIIISVAHHQAQRNQVIDQVVSLLSLVYTIQKHLNTAK